MQQAVIGAVIGDVVGSKYEFAPIKTKDFELFADVHAFTDDTVMTLAVAQALMDCGRDLNNMSALSAAATRTMRSFGQTYPHPAGGYGARFAEWLRTTEPRPYNSYGNGAPMRVSPCGAAATSLEEAIMFSKAVTEVTHNHPEGIKGAECVACCIFWARSGKTKEEIRELVEKNYYKLDFTLDSIRSDYEFDESAQGTVPPAIEAFLEAESFEDAIRNAISLGGDSDTLADITGAIAGCFYEIPNTTLEIVSSYLPEQFNALLEKFYQFCASRAIAKRSK